MPKIRFGLLTFFLGCLLPITAYFFYVTNLYAISVLPFVSLSLNFALAVFFGIKTLQDPKRHPLDVRLGRYGLLVCTIFVVGVLAVATLLLRLAQLQETATVHKYFPTQEYIR